MQETCLRPDIRYGKLSVPVSRSETASPAPLSDFILPPATNFQLDYTSPFICKIDLSLLRPHPQPANGSLCSSPVPLTDQNNLLAVDVGDASGEISDQSHLTKVVVGVEEDGEGVGMLETPEEILMEVQEAAEAAKENLDANFPGGVTTCFLNRGPEGKTMLNILNPHDNEGQWCPLAFPAPVLVIIGSILQVVKNWIWGRQAKCPLCVLAVFVCMYYRAVGPCVCKKGRGTLCV